MRALIVSLLLTATWAGCVTDDGAGPTPLERDHQDDAVVLRESFEGVVVSVNTPAVGASPDQAGDAERWFYVHEETQNLTLHLRTNQYDLVMHVRGPDCHHSECTVQVGTEDQRAVQVFQSPKAGPWEVAFLLRGDGAEEVYYELEVVKEQVVMHDPEHEVYSGEAVALHLGVVRISPDQLGEVYREFWVHEGTALLTVNVTVDEDVQFVLGQSFPARDRGSEEGWDTDDGRLALTFEDPRPGGWYYIIFHETEGPGVAEVAYTVDVTKHQGAEPSP